MKLSFNIKSLLLISISEHWYIEIDESAGKSMMANLCQRRKLTFKQIFDIFSFRGRGLGTLFKLYVYSNTIITVDIHN